MKTKLMRLPLVGALIAALAPLMNRNDAHRRRVTLDFANEGEDRATREGAMLREILELDDDATDEEIDDAFAALGEGDEPESTEAANAKDAEIADLLEQLDAANENWRKRHALHMEDMVNAAVEDGAMPAADAEEWIESLCNSYDAAWPLFEKARKNVYLPTSSKTKDLGARGHEIIETERERVAKVQDMVNARMKEKGEGYDTAFANVVAENPALFPKKETAKK